MPPYEGGDVGEEGLDDIGEQGIERGGEEDGLASEEGTYDLQHIVHV